MKDNLTSVDIYFKLEEVLKSIKGKEELDDIFFRAIKKLFQMPTDKIEKIEFEYKEYKKNGYDIETFLKKIFEIAEIDFEAVKPIVNERKRIEEELQSEVIARVRDGKKTSEKLIDSLGPDSPETKIGKMWEKFTEGHKKTPPEESIQEIRPPEKKTQKARPPEIRLPEIKIHGINSSETKRNPQFISIQRNKPDKQPETIPMVIKDFSTKNWNDDIQRDIFIMRDLCLNGRTLKEISLNGVPVPVIENSDGFPEIKSILEIIKKRIRTVRTCIGNQETKLRYHDDIIRVLTWVLGEDENGKNITKIVNEEITRKENDARVQYRSGGYISAMNRCFKDPDTNNVDWCTMMFIMERLKRGHIKVKKQSDYENGGISRAKNNIKNAFIIANRELSKEKTLND